jgi:hypothetical protein
MDWTARSWGLVRMAVTRSAVLRKEKCVGARDREGSERSCLLRMVRVCLSLAGWATRKGISISDSHALCCEAPAKLQLERIADWQGSTKASYTFETVMAAAWARQTGLCRAIGLTTMQSGTWSR